VHWLDFKKGILLLEMHGTNIKIKNKIKINGTHVQSMVTEFSYTSTGRIWKWLFGGTFLK
jgi:hypothetical protein